jgi:ABC-type multidrug transport system fused ATPase/permease subunit
MENLPRRRGITIRRLLSYSKDDTLLLVPGFVFLLGAATGEIFVPLFTGRVINSIIIQKSYAAFITNILYLGLVSLGAAIATGIRGACLGLTIARVVSKIGPMKGFFLGPRQGPLCFMYILWMATHRVFRAS